jgi:hypothetical protein
MAEEQPAPANHRPLSNNDLILFGGMALMLVIVGVIGYWVEPFRGVVANGVSALIGAGTMYLRGK